MPKNVLVVSQVGALACVTALTATAQAYSAQAPEEILANSAASACIESVAEIEAVTDQNVARWVKFQQLRKQWHAERGAKASVAQMAMTPAYQKIRAMGKDVLPIILA